MSFFKKLFVAMTGQGTKFDPLKIWGDGGKAAAAAEEKRKIAEAEANAAKEAAAIQSEETRKRQLEHEQSLRNIELNNRKLSDANNARTAVSNVVTGGTAGDITISNMKRRKAGTNLSSSLGINI